MAIKGINNAAMPPVRGVRTWVRSTGRTNIPAQNTRYQRKRKTPTIYSKWS
jgi:hypothetical protein